VQTLNKNFSVAVYVACSIDICLSRTCREASTWQRYWRNEKLSTI